MSEAGGPVILAWETCSGNGVVAISKGRDLLGETRFRTVKGHAGWLMPLIDSTVGAAGIGRDAIGAVACGTGPGGYTGVKVGVTTAKAAALALGLPLIGVPTLDLLAAHAPPGTGKVLSCMDARQGLVYVAGYAAVGTLPERVTAYACVTPGEAGRMAASMGGGEVRAIGEVPCELVESAREAGAEVSVVEPEAPGFPAGAKLGALAWTMWERGLEGDAFSVVPIYLKKPV
jgi:tRNA threonylcarbamoyladenosine biosynthesis protein TsaB